MGDNYHGGKLLMGIRVVIGLNKGNVEIALAKKNKSKKWLADKLGTHYVYLSQMLSGERNPGPEMREKITMAFHKRLCWDDIFTIRKVIDDTIQR